MSKLTTTSSRPPPWTEVETAVLQAMYPTQTAQRIALLIQRDAQAIRKKANEMGIKKLKHSAKFHRPIGSERMDRGHLIRKVTDTGQPKKDWKRVEVIEWEEKNGPIPAGMQLMVKNPALPRTQDNLALFSKRGHWQRMTLHNLPPELQGLLQLKGQITRAIGRRTKAPAEE